MLNKAKFTEKTFFTITLILSFLISFVLYIITLAPTVTLEDSGELIAAAYNCGIPHQPGYPLFTLIGRIFSMIPIGNIAYRLNIMSAFFTAFAAMVISWVAVVLIESIYPETKNESSPSNKPFFKYGISLAAGILVSSSFEIWEQAVITEVYGLHNALIAIFLLAFVYFRKTKHNNNRLRYFILMCFVTGLALTNHSTSLFLIPLLFVILWLEDKVLLVNLRYIVHGFIFFIIGMTPFIYLPIASSNDPIIDWGNPENFTNFIRTITRHQYQEPALQSINKYFTFLGTYSELLFEQFAPWVLIVITLMVLRCLVKLFHEKKSYFYFSLVFILLTTLIKTYFVNNENIPMEQTDLAIRKAVNSVFYTPSYMFFILLASVGLYGFTKPYHNRKILANIILIGIFLLPISNMWFHYKKVDMSNYTYAEDYANNLFKVADSNAVIISFLDPFTFPLLYYQFVENQRQDIFCIDQELLRRSWYVNWLKQKYPEFTKEISTAIELFLTAVKPSEEGKPFNGDLINSKYYDLVNSIINNAILSGRSVYLTYLPTKHIATQYFKEPIIGAYKLTSSDKLITDVNINSFSFRNFEAYTKVHDRMLEWMKQFYIEMFFYRIRALSSMGREKEANELRKLREIMKK